MTERTRRVTPAVVAGVTVLLAVCTLVVAASDHVTPAGFLDENQANTWLAGICLSVVGAAVLRDAPGNVLGPLMAVGGLCATLSAFGQSYATLAGHRDLPLRGPAAWAASSLWLPAIVILTLAIPLLFPDGHLTSARWRWPARIGVLGAVVGVVGLATIQVGLDDAGFADVHNPLDLPIPDDLQVAVTVSAVLVALAVGLCAVGGLLIRMRTAAPAERPRYAWFAAAILLGLSSLLPWPATLDFLLNVGIFLAIGIGIVRHRMFDIEPVLSRTLVYITLSALAVGVYLGAAALVGAKSQVSIVPGLLTAVAALLLARVQGRAQSVVDRLLYGDRGDPDSALARLGERLAAALTTDEVLPATVEAVRRTLRLPYAELRLSDEVDAACASGTKPDATASFPLVHAGADVGELTVGLRSGERSLSGADTELLTSFARQVAIAAHDVRTTRELRRSREQVVATREEERARIHRDLHDGLGPALAGISLGLETATRTAVRDGPAAADLLDELQRETAACVDEVRRIVADLRPPALDDAGLVGALRRQADLLTLQAGGAITVEVVHQSGNDLGPLPSAVEVAAYRIASEAMTNAVRHAEATRCRVQLDRDRELHLRVEDDGTGSPPIRLGTGIRSMRQRAEELGGQCTVTFRRGEGTLVSAVLPVTEERTP